MWNFQEGIPHSNSFSFNACRRATKCRTNDDTNWITLNQLSLIANSIRDLNSTDDTATTTTATRILADFDISTKKHATSYDFSPIPNI